MRLPILCMDRQYYSASTQSAVAHFDADMQNPQQIWQQSHAHDARILQQQRPSPIIGNSTIRRSVLTATINRQHQHQHQLHPDIDTW